VAERQRRPPQKRFPVSAKCRSAAAAQLHRDLAPLHWQRVFEAHRRATLRKDCSRLTTVAMTARGRQTSRRPQFLCGVPRAVSYLTCRLGHAVVLFDMQNRTCEPYVTTMSVRRNLFAPTRPCFRHQAQVPPVVLFDMQNRTCEPYVTTISVRRNLFAPTRLCFRQQAQVPPVVRAPSRMLTQLMGEMRQNHAAKPQRTPQHSLQSSPGGAPCS
jgi:hypothetical protein